MNLDAYLRHIGISDVGPPTLDLLRLVVAGHAATIPFENLDILLGRRISLDMAAIEAKLVGSRRGGYCFEQNALLRAALEALGFRVSCRMARVVRGAPAGAVTPRTHMLLRVELPEGAFLADVGFGNLTPTAPLRWDGAGEQATGHETYRLVPGLRLEVRLGDVWEPAYRFEESETFPIDHAVANWFTSTYPGGKFTANGIAARPGPGCRKDAAERGRDSAGAGRFGGTVRARNRCRVAGRSSGAFRDRAGAGGGGGSAGQDARVRGAARAGVRVDAVRPRTVMAGEGPPSTTFERTPKRCPWSAVAFSITLRTSRRAEADMSSITIRNLDPVIKERLRVRAAEHGHSMEAEVRGILQSALKGPARAPASNLYERIRALVEPVGGIDIELPPRELDRNPPTFD